MKTLFRRTLLSAALAVAALPAVAQSTPDSPFTQTVFFGDSLTDAGFFRPLLPVSVRPVTGQFTTNPGYVWSQYMADYYGTAANPNGNGQTGTNYAAGGARVGVNSTGALGPIPSMATQTANYLAANGGRADAHALYTVWGGANDLFAITSGGADPTTTIGGAVSAQIGIVGTLTQAGAQYILVPTVPDLGVTPAFRAQGALAQAQGTALTVSYNNALFSGLAASNLRVIPLDTFHFLQEVVANPSAYGLTNITGTACQPQITANSLTCNPTSYVSPDAPYTYLFADGVHPTSAGHRALADFAISVIDGPRLIALLPRSATTTGRARAQMVDGVAAGMAMAEGDGMQWWADVRGQQQRFVNSNGFDGVGGTGSFGVGWRRGQLSYGAFAGYGRQDLDFGFRRGDFRQTDTSVGGFVGWTGEGLWANGQVSWTKLGFKVNRQVNLGQATRIHSGSPDGDNLSAGASVGWTFTHGRLQHGPVLSVLSQRISVDGYAENSTESTALAYPKQDIDSLIGSLGWQANYAINDHVKPYVRLTMDREFKDAPAQAYAQSLSMPGTLPYAVPGLAFDDGYGTLGLGVRSKLLGLDVNVGANVTVEQKGGSDASFFLTVGGAF
ncbi:autotransporter domain-containing protein [Thermomonas sp.]|uniref:autotransporter domain-containing protein n=1 Tax=Thermomonas sp. TaxID=1971895 RepID=UPI00391D2C0F